MTFRNDGQSDSNILQNRFTAYLQTALRRKRQEYLLAQNRLQSQVVSLDDTDLTSATAKELEAYLSYEFQIENEELLQALARLSNREQLILLAHVLDSIDFDALADRHDLSYKGVATLYYRVRKKLRKYMGGDGP